MHSKCSILVSYYWYYRITHFTNKSMPLGIFLSLFLPKQGQSPRTLSPLGNVLQCLPFLPHLSSPGPILPSMELSISAYSLVLWSQLQHRPLPLLFPSYKVDSVNGLPSLKPCVHETFSFLVVFCSPFSDESIFLCS